MSAADQVLIGLVLGFGFLGLLFVFGVIKHFVMWLKGKSE